MFPDLSLFRARTMADDAPEDGGAPKRVLKTVVFTGSLRTWSSVHSCMYVICMQFSCMGKLGVHKHKLSCVLCLVSVSARELAFVHSQLAAGRRNFLHFVVLRTVSDSYQK